MHLYYILWHCSIYFSLLYVMVGRLFLAIILNTHAFPVNRLECGQTQKMNIALADGSVVLVLLII